VSATTAFKNYWRSGIRYTSVLVRIDVRDPFSLATTTMRFASAETNTPTGLTSGEPRAYWSPMVIEFSPVSAPGSFGGTSVELCSTGVVLNAGAIPNTLLLDGAAVRIWLWDTRLSDWDDSLPVFTGVVIRSVANAATLTLDLRQRTDWNRVITPVTVTAEAYPHAPEDSIGQRIPVVYGRHTVPELRRPWAPTATFSDITGATVFRGRSLVMGSTRVGRGVLVDTGRGAGATVNPKAKVLVASHKCATVADHLFNAGVFMKAGDTLAGLEAVSGGDVINTATEAGLLIPDDSDMAWVSVRPTDVLVVANTLENPRAVLDPLGDTNYAKADWTNGFKTLRMKLAALEELGEMTGVFMFVGYRSVANTNLTLRLGNTVSGAVVDMAMAATSTRTLLMKRVGTAWNTPPLGQPWSFVDNALEVGWPTGVPVITGTGTAEIYLAGLVVRFKPRLDVVTSERIFDRTERRPRAVPPGGQPGHTKPAWGTYVVHETLPAVTELKGEFFANVEGYMDNGQYAPANTFTGNINAVIERPSDVITHLLVAYGGELLADVERGVGVFGSLIDARALFTTRLGDTMLMAFSVEEAADLMTALSWIGVGSFAHIYLDRFTDKWHMLPWNDDRAVNYDWTFTPGDIVERESMTVERTPLSDVLTGVDLYYGHDAFTGSYQHQARLAWDGSTAGQKYRGLRDEYLSVTTAQNKLDFTTDHGTFAATLTLGDYDVVSYGLMVQAAMKAVDTTNEFHCINGATIVSSGTDGNDEVFFRDHIAGIDRTVSLASLAGSYASLQAMLTAVAAAMTTACGTPGQPIVAAYTRSNRKVSFQRVDNVGHTAVQLTLYTLSGSLRNRRFYSTLGWTQPSAPPASSSPIVAPDEREEELFTVGCLGANTDILWETGTNGLKGTRLNCAAGLGFSTLRDSLAGGAHRIWLGDCPKHNREQALMRTALRYGAKKDTSMELPTVNDTETARELRVRTTRLLGRPRVTVTFSTEMAPDLERGRVIQFSAGFDALVPFPDPDTDLSWAGKRFVVVETEQHLGPVAFYTKVVAVALD
jgi:hypothetical protein